VVEERFSEKEENGAKEEPSDGLEERPRHDEWIGGLAHPLVHPCPSGEVGVVEQDEREDSDDEVGDRVNDDGLENHFE
jgi:hypothetical protein